jgi:hypothetical protein
MRDKLHSITLSIRITRTGWIIAVRVQFVAK